MRAPDPADNPRNFTAADDTEQRLRAEAALTRQELGNTVGELTRRANVKSAARDAVRRRWSRRKRSRIRGFGPRPGYLVVGGVTALVVWAVVVFRTPVTGCRRAPRRF